MRTVAACSVVLAVFNACSAFAQYTPPPPPAPFPGFINEFLRAQNPSNSVWDIGGSARFRYELKAGALGLPPANDFRDVTTGTTRNDNEFLASKILFRVAYTNPWWGAHVEGRSSETWGDARSNTGAGAVPGPGGGNGPETDGPVDLHQAWFTVGNLKEYPVSLKVGRQELIYGDERLVGNAAWLNTGRVFDAAKLRWQKSSFALDAFVSKVVLPDDNTFNTWNDYSVFSGLYLTTKLIPKVVMDIYFFSRNEDAGVGGAQAGAVLPFQTPAPFARDIYTFGARLKSSTENSSAFDYTVEGAYQFGDWQGAANSPHLDHSAYMFIANVGYTIPQTTSKPRFALEYAFGSGDNAAADGTHGTFDNLYPSNHKFYGYMDLFALQNLHDVRAIFTIKLVPRLSLAVEGHMFWAAEGDDVIYNAGGIGRTTPGSTAGSGNGFNINPSYGKHLGNEVDVIAGYTLNKFATIEAGYGHFFVGDYIGQTWSNPAIGSKDADWFYVQAVVRF